jgi:ankyrin repeat protein
MRAARSIPASGETFQYIFSIAKRLGFSALDVDIEHATIAHHSIRQYSSNPTEIIANLIALKNLGVDLNARNYDGLKIFHLTGADRTDAIIAAAHDLGITVDFQDICTGGNNSSLAMLSSACRNNNVTSVRALLEVAIPASMLGDVKGFAPLHAACAAVNAQRAKDNVAALLEQRERLQLDLDPLLLTTSVWGWLPSPACGSGVTPLMIAVAYNYNDAALLLINAGAAINSVHPTKSNLFHYACERGNITVLDALCAKLTDADRHLVVDVNRSGFTPLLYLGWKLGMYGFETAKVEQMAETLLVAAGPLAAELVNVLDSRGRTVLFYAQRRRADSFCQLLLRFGAKEVSLE